MHQLLELRHVYRQRTVAVFLDSVDRKIFFDTLAQKRIVSNYVNVIRDSIHTHQGRIASHPSTNSSDLACLVSPPINSTRSATHTFAATTYLSCLQAPSVSGSGDYREVSSSPLYCPSASHIFTSNLKTHPSQMMRTSNSTDHAAVTSASHAIRWSSFQQAGHLAVAFESGVLGWDIRSMQPTFWLEAAHWPCVRDLDFNPHRPTILATGGDDGHIRLWDLRYLKPKPNAQRHDEKPLGTLFGSTDSCTEPLYSLAAHSHWVWSVRYHPTRDQLLLSTGSDYRVCIHNLASFSSDATDDAFEEDPEGDDHGSCTSSVTSDTKPSIRPRSKDGLVARMELHEESVYAADWSPVDPWYFASVSYDGNLLINQVPEKLKFSILLDSNEE